MTERTDAKMAQYHIEGEHVFPEPECPSCRLDAALRRAAEKARLFTSDTLAGEYIAGWAEAIRAVDAEHESRKFTQGDECGGKFCTSCKAIATFIRAMLGGDGA